jgi:hypothetical protein
MFHHVRRCWHYSRTIFLNVLSALLMMASELVSYLTGASWASIIDNPKLLFFVTVGINALNIFLRYLTTHPIGADPTDPPDPPEPQ